MANCLTIGEAAGCAALSLRTNTEIPQLDLPLLRESLRKNGAVLDLSDLD